MYRNAEWLSDLTVSYDMSVPNSARLEPQRGGCCTVFPYFIGDIVELPLTMIQDFSLFNMLRTHSSDLWEQQVEVILEQQGLMSFIVHPDYILDETALRVYQGLLGRLMELKETQGVWLAKPGEVARWWRERHALRLVSQGRATGSRVRGASGHASPMLTWTATELAMSSPSPELVLNVFTYYCGDFSLCYCLSTLEKGFPTDDSQVVARNHAAGRFQ